MGQVSCCRRLRLALGLQAPAAAAAAGSPPALEGRPKLIRFDSFIWHHYRRTLTTVLLAVGPADKISELGRRLPINIIARS